jgi:RES domain
LTDHAEDIDTEDRCLCSGCVGETFLRAKIERSGQDGVCYYCGDDGKTFSIGEMADEFEIALEEHYYLTPAEPSFMEYVMAKESEYDWEREGDPITEVISWCAEIEPEPAEDIRIVLSERHFDAEHEQMLEECPFDQEAHYAGKEVDNAESQSSWEYFEENLKTQTRYFNRAAEDLLTSIFSGIGEQTTIDGRPIIVEAGSETKLTTVYRARVFQSSERLIDALIRPDKEIGPPPPKAATSGRMNAHGIAVFYGATDPAIALAEVRPPVGSKVVVGSFELIRPIRLLDVEALRSVNAEGSIFDREYIRRKERAKFLHWLSRRITMPVMPDDEPFEYLPTQVVADFLATEADPPLDGILYPSAQGSEGQLNVVLFHKAARVQGIDIPKGAELSASISRQTDEGLEDEYWVSEEMPLEESSAPSQEHILSVLPDIVDEQSIPEGYDPREATLRLDVSTLQVHYIKGVTFDTESRSVFRHRFEKRGAEF